jgi:hypothetical protein
MQLICTTWVPFLNGHDDGQGKDKDTVENVNLYHFMAFFALAAIC